MTRLRYVFLHCEKKRQPRERKMEVGRGEGGGGINLIFVSIIRLFNPYPLHFQNVSTAASLSLLEFIFLIISYHLTISMLLLMGEF